MPDPERDVTRTSTRTSTRTRGLAALGALALLAGVLVPSAQLPASATGTCAATGPAGAYGGGAGSTGDPYLIADEAQLLKLATTSGDWNKHFRQTDNLNLTGCTWSLIGTSTTVFTGSFDGGDHTITGLTFSTSGSRAGMFGEVGDGGLLENIRLVDVSISSSGDGRIGALVGEVDPGSSGTATVRNVSATNVTVVYTGADERVGGLIGSMLRSGATLSNAFIAGTVEVTANNAASERVGGLVGFVNFGTVRESFVTGDAAITGVNSRIGGLVGELGTPGTIERSFVTAGVTVTGARRTGGLVGASNATVVDSFSEAAVVQDPLDSMRSVGGLIGDNGGTVNRSYAVGLVTGASGAGNRTGGLIGEGSGAVTASFWDTTETGLATSAGGAGAVGLATPAMLLRSTFDTAGWAIVQGWQAYDPSSGPTWGICEDETYPFLLWVFEADFCSEVEEEGATGTVASTPVLVGGVPPVVPTGTGAWVQSDGSSVPLAVTSPGANQLRYAADGIEVTFTGGAGSSVTNGLVADANGEVVCEVCATLPVGGVIEVWMFSDPRLVAAHRVDVEPCQQFSILVVAPLDGGGPVSAGAHTLQLALPTASGMQAVNVGVTVGGPVPASVPAGEGSVPLPFALLLAALVSVGGAVLVGRRALAVG